MKTPQSNSQYRSEYGKEIERFRQSEKSFAVRLIIIFATVFICLFVGGRLLFLKILDQNDKINIQAELNETLEESCSKTQFDFQELQKITFREFSGADIGEDQFNDSLFYEMLLANAKISYLDTLKPGRVRSDVVIRYYFKAKDGSSVFNLSKAGYLVHKRPPSKSSEDLASNSILYGKDVDTLDILLVALSLIKSGIPIKQIEPFPEDDWRKTSIQIEAIPALEENSAISVNHLFKRFNGEKYMD